MSTTSDIMRYVAICDEANAILNSDASWETKFDLIFSDNISIVLQTIHLVGWCDPNTSYEEDVKAFMAAVNRKCTEFRSILKSIEEQNNGKGGW